MYKKRSYKGIKNIYLYFIYVVFFWFKNMGISHIQTSILQGNLSFGLIQYHAVVAAVNDDLNPLCDSLQWQHRSTLAGQIYKLSVDYIVWCWNGVAVVLQSYCYLSSGVRVDHSKLHYLMPQPHYDDGNCGSNSSDAVS